MTLSPEERKKVYEEEKAKLEAGEAPGGEKDIPGETGTGLPPHVVGWLCYLGVWVTGIIFFFIEQQNRWVRFHAAQSLVVFGIFAIAGVIFGWIPFIGQAIAAIIGLAAFILWIILQVKAYNGERYKVPWAGDIAEMLVNSTTPHPEKDKKAETHQPPPEKAPGTANDLDRQINKKIEEFFQRKRAGRITTSAIAIAWSMILLIFFNFFHQYVAYYNGATTDGDVVWTRQPLFTNEIYLWLPILTITMIFSVVIHSVLIVFDRYVLRQILYAINDAFGLATTVTLLLVFPFDFSVIPGQTAAAGLELGVTVVLICISIGFSVSILVRTIRLLANLVKGTADYHKAG